MNTTPDPENTTPIAGLKNRAMVLLVDDQPIIGEAIRRLLADEPDIEFHYCPNPADAIKIANQIRPTVILQDLVMPNINGLELVRRFRANTDTKETPIIVLSTKEDPMFKRDAFGFGANDYLVKLPDKMELMARVRYHSKSYLNMLQRDEAYRGLRESQHELLASNAKLGTLNQELQDALSQVKQLQGLFPICCYCKKIRDDQNYWEQIEHYISKHSNAQFSHGVCPDCFEKHTVRDLKNAEEERKERARRFSAKGEIHS